MSTAHETTSPTELIDSLLHGNIKRMVVGTFLGAIAGAVMLVLTTLSDPLGIGKLWWLKMLATSCHGGAALAIEGPFSVLLWGAALHFFLSMLCGFIVGKLTSRNDLGRLSWYGVVLGFMCWLATNMFAPNVVLPEALYAVPQWYRVFYYMAFTLTLTTLMSFVGKILKL